MPKITLDMHMFKALASETRLDILKTLDGRKLCLNEICDKINLNKATLHEHLSKLNEAGLVKRKERMGHKWVYYTLTWKGESLLHPENTRIVIMFSATFISLFFGFINIINLFMANINYNRGAELVYKYTIPDDKLLLVGESSSNIVEYSAYNDMIIISFIIFFILISLSVWRYKINKKVKL